MDEREDVKELRESEMGFIRFVKLVATDHA